MLVMTPSAPQSGSRWPLTLVWSSLVVQDMRMPRTSKHQGHQNLQVIQTGPTPVCQDKPKFGNVGSLNGFLDTWVQPVRVDPWSIVILIILNNLGAGVYAKKTKKYSLKEAKTNNMVKVQFLWNLSNFINFELKMDIPDLVTPLSFPQYLISWWNLHV